MPLTRTAAVTALLLSLLVGCERTDPEPLAESPEAQRGSFAAWSADTSKRPDRDIDSTSLRNMSDLLAGVLPPEESDQDIDPEWRKHAEFMDRAWVEIDRRLAAMSGWANDELGDIGMPTAPLLYPFGGPDLISAQQFFPGASSYLLVGLEAPGHLPLPEHFSGSALAGDLERLRRPFESLAEAGYFVRNEIDQDLSGGHFDGVLPILLIGLVRSGHVPIRLDYVTIDPETIQIRPLEPSDTDASAIRLHFLPREAADRLAEDPEADPGVEPRTVYYFAQDMSNRGLYLDDPFSRLILRLPATNVYIKSGEYLAHMDDFSNFRKLVVKTTQTLVQDDSGLPIEALTSDRWSIDLYGQYTNVLAAYSQWLQEDLAAAFSKGKAQPLPFSLGYNSGTDGGCLIVAERVAADGP
ncbi:MAG: hypothetical protein AAGE94_06865 [Acidobacteriota bacterium]